MFWQRLCNRMVTRSFLSVNPLVSRLSRSFFDHDWKLGYQPSATSRAGIPFARGRVTGGSSAVNTAIALRGVPSDYDEWASLGNPEWAWEKVLPAFCKLETDVDFDGPYHG